MFERFTDRARRVVVLSEEFARSLDHGYIGTEHLWYALAEEGESIAATALALLGFRAEHVRQLVAARVPAGELPPPPPFPFSLHYKKALEHALRESLRLGHNYMAPEHLLLGIADESDCTAMSCIVSEGRSRDEIRAVVLGLLADAGTLGPAQTEVSEARTQRRRAPSGIRLVPDFEAPFGEIRTVIPMAALAVVPDGAIGNDEHDRPIAGLWYVRADIAWGVPDPQYGGITYLYAPAFGETPEEACQEFLRCLRAAPQFSVDGVAWRWHPASFVEVERS